MNCFLTPPESRSPNDTAYSVDAIRREVLSGRMSADTVFYCDNETLYTAGQIISRPPPVPSRRVSVPVPRQNQKSSLKPLWIGLGVFVGLIALTAVAALALVHYVREAEMKVLSDVPMLEERKTHKTKWQENDGFEASGPPPEPDGKVLKLVRYPAPDGDLAAYLSPDPGDGKKHPVIIWSKGGFGGIGDYFWEAPSRLNDQSARAFREAGIVLMCPSYRGENDNPGKFELFYGEVEDFLAAVDYAKKLPYVDPDRVYIGGHSTGGTISLLAAATGIECRGVFSFGGEPDLLSVMADGEGYDNTPYDIKSERDHKLRSPIRYTSFIKSPTWYIEGGVYEYSNSDAKKMQRIAKKKGVPFQALIIENGDHFDILTPATKVIAQKILADTGDKPIQLSAGELNAEWQRINGISLTSELNRWLRDGGDLAAILENLETDVEPGTYTEINLIKTAVEKVLANDPDKNSDIAELAEICDYISDDNLTAVYFDRVGPLLKNYIKDSLKKKKRSEQAEDNCMRIAGTFAYSGDPTSAPLIAKLARRQFDPADDNWGYIIDEIEEQSETGLAIVKALKNNPPLGQVADRILSRINNTFVDEEDSLESHPYDSEKGAEALGKMIDENGDQTFHATLALAFISEPYRKMLLPRVLEHPRAAIRLEAAWADALHGGEEGIKILQQACRDLNYSETAKNYFRELNLEDRIPPEALDPDFTAKAQMIKWLQHPNELGRSPESIEMIDSRKLYWPPDEKERKLWLFEFTYRFDEEKPFKTSYGMVGAQAWSSFKEYETEPTIANLYAHHCALEFRWQDEDNEISADEALRLLKQKNPGELK